MRLIDADALVDRITELAEINREWKPEYSEFCDDIVCMIEDTPFWNETDFTRNPKTWDSCAADFVKVVRCKDCIYNELGTCDLSEALNPEYEEDYFCRDGYKRHNDETIRRYGNG